MESDVQDQGGTLIDTAAIAQLPWLSVFDQDIPAKVFSAICYGDGLVVINGQADVAAEAVAVVIGRLHEAGFSSQQMTGPQPSLSLLHDAVRDTRRADAAVQRPLVVVIAQAETLSTEIVKRLIALATLKEPGGKPVLRFLLTGTAALWPVLRNAGLGHLEHDAAAHIRLSTKDAARPQAPEPQVPESRVPEPRVPGPGAFDRPTAAPPRPVLRKPARAAGLPESHPFSPPPSTRLRIALAGIGLAGIGLVGWVLLAPGPVHPVKAALLAPAVVPAPPPLSPDERFAILLDREKQEIAANHLWSPPGDNLIETRRQIDEILPLLSTHALRLLAEASTHTGVATGKRFADITGPALSSGVDEPRIPHPDAGKLAIDRTRPGPQATPVSPPAVPVAPPPVLSQPAASPADDPAGDLVHVTLRYSRGDNAAQARATRMLALLRARGILVDEPEASGTTIGRSSLAYYFSQDQATAHNLAQQLLPGILQADKLEVRKLAASSGAKLPRPGEISILIGSRDDDDNDNDAGDTPAPSGKQT